MTVLLSEGVGPPQVLAQTDPMLVSNKIEVVQLVAEEVSPEEEVAMVATTEAQVMVHMIKPPHPQKCLLMRATANHLKIPFIKTTVTVRRRPIVSTVRRPALQMAAIIRDMEIMKVRLKIKTKTLHQQSMANFAGFSFETKACRTGDVVCYPSGRLTSKSFSRKLLGSESNVVSQAAHMALFDRKLHGS